MNTFLAVCLCGLIAGIQGASLTAEQEAKVREYYGECIKETEVEKEVVSKARNGEFTDDVKLNNFIFCMLRKVDFISEDGKLNYDTIKSKVPSDVSQENVEKVFKACSDVKGDTPQQVARNVYQCYLTATPVRIHLA